MSFREELQELTSQKVEESLPGYQKLEEEFSRRFDESIKEFIESINHEDIISELKVKATESLYTWVEIRLDYPDKLEKVIIECDALVTRYNMAANIGLNKYIYDVPDISKIEEAVTKHIKLNPGLAEVYRGVVANYDELYLEFYWGRV